MNDELKQWQADTIPLDEWERDIVPHGNHLPITEEITVEDFNAQYAALTGVNKPPSKRADTQRIGRNSEARAKRLLIKMGFEDVRKMSTKFNGTYAVRARADFAGVWPDTGQDMLCEVKHTKEPKLGCPALRKHQTKNLSNLARRGGIALLIWTYEKEKIVMRWGVDGIDGFVKGAPLTIERARELHINSIEKGE